MTLNQLSVKIAELYAAQDVLVEHMPYTKAFDDLFDVLVLDKSDLTKHQLWEHMLYLRKRGRLETKIKKTESKKNEAVGIKGFGF